MAGAGSFPKDGFFILDKPAGFSSQGAVTRVRRWLKADKAGHTGTLDPLATGVLPIAWGEATKVIPFTGEDEKEYAVEGILGQATDTYDAEGRPTERGEAGGVLREDLEASLDPFRGILEQLPPQFSAVKIKGRPAYSYAQRGEEVALKARRIEIFSLTLTSFDRPRFSLRVACSKGTYIRTLVHELGVALGCYAHVSALRRLRTGPFTLEGALPLPEREAEAVPGTSGIRSIEDVLAAWPSLALGDGEVARVRSGVDLTTLDNWTENQAISGPVLTLTHGGLIHAVCRKGPEGGWKYARVLIRDG